ncbi:MAG: hypothetical protein Q7P63_02630 [Verrucomicrobiota bacterium JB022]|nr:hypothetical protein [Verrucomicrobiota bacterium JB022]
MKPTLALLALCAAAPLAATPFQWKFYLPEEAGSASIWTMYQLDSSIYVGYVSNDWLPNSSLVTSDPIEFDGPTILVRHEIDERTEPFDYDNARKLYSYLLNEETVSYDPTLGDGWAKSAPFGWFFQRNYPWLWLNEKQDWWWVEEAGIGPDDWNAYWIWSSNNASWYWTTRGYYPWVYDSTNSTWVWDRS